MQGKEGRELPRNQMAWEMYKVMLPQNSLTGKSPIDYRDLSRQCFDITDAFIEVATKHAFCEVAVQSHEPEVNDSDALDDDIPY